MNWWTDRVVLPRLLDASLSQAPVAEPQPSDLAWARWSHGHDGAAGTTATGTALGVAVRSPSVLQADAALGDARGFLTGRHVHLVLVVDRDGTLLTTLDRADLDAVAHLPDDAPVRTLGTVQGRTVGPDLPVAEVTDLLRESGARRLAVVDDQRRLLGLVCLKRSRQGFCTDDGIEGRRSARRGPTDGDGRDLRPC